MFSYNLKTFFLVASWMLISSLKSTALPAVVDTSIRIAFLAANPYPEADKETRAAFDFLKTEKKFNPVYITFGEIRKKPKLLNSFRLVWFHRQDSSQFSSSETDIKVLDAINGFISNGGRLLLTLDAFHYINDLGIEPVLPKDSLKPSVDDGYGRKLGFHSYLDHPVFDGMYGGSYVMMPVKDTVFRMTGYFGNTLPQNGKVIGIDWDYIFLRESSKLVLEYTVGKGKVIAVGGYTCFSVPNFNRNHLELFTVNAFNYLLSEGSSAREHYWDYSPVSVTECPLKIQDIDRLVAAIPESKAWDHPADPLALTKRFAAENYFDVAGERMLTMGSETGGIVEIWAHPFMAFRDYEVGLKFEYRDTIYWLNDERPSIDVLPYCFVRTYKFPRAYLEEIIANDPQDPAGVIHYEYKGVYPAELVIRVKSNLRLMWPYSENVANSVCYRSDPDYHTLFVKDASGTFSAMIGANRKPAEEVAGQFSGFRINKENKKTEGIPFSDKVIAGYFRYPLQMTDRMDVVYAATSQGEKTTISNFDAAIRDPKRILDRAKQHTDNLLAHNLQITGPDANFNKGYRWAMLATDRFFVTTPGMGGSLVAGYSTTTRGWDGQHKVNGRPGYGWYFGRDGEWSGFALLDYGDFTKVKKELEFYIRYQDLSGKIFHEATTSGVIHYDASDATPLFIVLAGKYFRHTNDTAFLQSSWPAIKKAVDFCFSTDSDHDHLIENTNVGHGWVEGGELYGSHATLYLQGCWIAALDETANMASFLKLPDAESYSLEAAAVKNIVNTKFWNPKKKYFSYGMNKDLTFRSEATVLPAVPLAFRIGDADKARPVLDQLASNAFSTNWGTRIIRDDSPFFKPTGYHYGSVWPLFTGWTALAEYAYGNYPQGFSHIMNNLNLYKNWGQGFVEEVMNGATYEPSGVCPHQCWSETMVLQPAIEGMLGLKVKAQENKIEFAPHFPADWDSARVINIRMGNASFDFEMKRTSGHYYYTFTPHGNLPVTLEFMPSFPAGTKLNGVLKDGNETQFTSFNDPGTVSLYTILKLTGKCSLDIEFDKGIDVLPAVTDPKPGSGPAGLRIISRRLIGDKYFITVEGERKTSDDITVYIHNQDIEKIENGVLKTLKGDLAVMSVDFEPGGSRYLTKLVIIWLKQGPASGMLIKDQTASGPFLSNLHATRSDALFTTYAAPPARSDYKTDQGYSFTWNDDENGLEFNSKDGLNFGLAFSEKGELRYRLKELYQEPVMTVSYSDLAKYYYYPLPGVRVEIVFNVYSSEESFADIRIRNERTYPAELAVLPYLYCPLGDEANDILHQAPQDLYTFSLEKKRDGWMKEHSIPLTEKLRGVVAGDLRFDSVMTFAVPERSSQVKGNIDPFREIKEQFLINKKRAAVKGLIFSRNLRIYPGDEVHFRMVMGVEVAKKRIPKIGRKIQPVFSIDPKQLILENEKAYEKIPQLKSFDSCASMDDYRMLYYSCFSLLRQCMMPPEGACKTNYYVFSREPKWGWGYGGQVFHESLSMLAYAYMDPEGAMNSQRVYFDRQHPDGYINYRTGPYLDETIEYKGKLTTSAPWFSYENLEIYKVTKELHFLEEAYRSGEKFYRFYVANRDSNSNGLCEWGGEASLESVRDARVAVWDNVGWPSNFEGPDLNSMLVMEARSLAQMAKLLGLKDEAIKWDEDAGKRALLINQHMWDPVSGFYYNVNRNDQTFTYKKKDDLKIREIIGFLPLWAGVPGFEKTKTLMETMKNPDEFWRPYGIPTLSAKDGYYDPIGYWNGPVWVQWDYLVFRGLLDRGYKKEAEELAKKVLDNMIWHLKQDHVFWEFYSPDDRKAGWNRTYIWAGIAARFFIDLEK
ncbi:MAG: GH116 family glycosyl hydrolase [Bacteroidetes bacterium]|nr:GH116 family glycosyl hydrolase [Bacteroidota bacterium]